MQLKLNAAGVCQAEWILISNLRLYNKDQEDILTSHDVSLTSPLGLMLNSTYSSFPRKFLGRSSNSDKSQNASVFSVWALCLSPVLLHIISCLIHGCFKAGLHTRLCEILRSASLLKHHYVNPCRGMFHPYATDILTAVGPAQRPTVSWKRCVPSAELFLWPAATLLLLHRPPSSASAVRQHTSADQSILSPSVCLWCISNPSFTIAANSDSVGFWVLTRRWVIYSRGLFDLDHQTKRMKEWYDVISL